MKSFILHLLLAFTALAAISACASYSPLTREPTNMAARQELATSVASLPASEIPSSTAAVLTAGDSPTPNAKTPVPSPTPQELRGATSQPPTPQPTVLPPASAIVITQKCLEIRNAMPLTAQSITGTVAYWPENSQGYLLNLKTGGQHSLPGQTPNTGTAASPSGHWLAYSREFWNETRKFTNQKLWVVAADGTTQASVTFEERWYGWRWLDDEHLEAYDANKLDGTVLIFNPFTGQQQMLAPSFPNIYQHLDPSYWLVEYAPDLTWVVYLDNNYQIVVWDVSAHKVLFRASGADVLRVPPKWSPSGDQVAVVAGGDLYRINRAGQIVRLNAQPLLGSVTALSWSPDEHYLAFWQRAPEPDVPARQQLLVLDTLHNQISDYCLSADDYIPSPPSWSSDGQQFITGGSQLTETLILVDLAQCIAARISDNLLPNAWLKSEVISPPTPLPNRTATPASPSSTPSAAPWAETRMWGDMGRAGYPELPGGQRWAVSPDRQWIALAPQRKAGQSFTSLKLLRMSDGQAVHTFRVYTDTEHPLMGVDKVVFSPGGESIVAAQRSPAVDPYHGLFYPARLMIWDMKGDHRLLFDDMGEWFWVFSPGGDKVARVTLGNSSEMLSTADGRLLYSFDCGTPSFSNDGQLFATLCGAAVNVYQTADGTLLRTTPLEGGEAWTAEEVRLLGFTAQNKGVVLDVAAIGLEETIRVFGLADGRQWLKIHRASHDQGSDDVVLSPLGNFVAVASGQSEDGATVELWDLNSGQLTRKFDEGYVFSFRFSPDESMLAISKRWWSPAEITIWRISDGSLLQVLKTSRFEKPAITFRGDGSILGAEFPDGSLHLWRVGSP